MRYVLLSALAFALLFAAFAALVRDRVTAADEFDAAAACQGNRVVIENRGAEMWSNVKIEVNGSYVFIADAIPPKETMRYFASIFTKPDGTRLDLARVACQRIDIHATVNGKRRHANFGTRR